MEPTQAEHTSRDILLFRNISSQFKLNMNSVKHLIELNANQINQNLIHSKFISLTFHDKMSIHILHIQHTILDHTIKQYDKHMKYSFMENFSNALEKRALHYLKTSLFVKMA